MDKERRLVEITAPHVGICWLTPNPDSPPFVEVGDTVTPTWREVADEEPRATVALVECSKLYSDVDHKGPLGKVVEIRVKNGDHVETDDVIMIIAVDPDAKAPPKPTIEEILRGLKQSSEAVQRQLDQM
ncbi:MAG: biotin/lipoyl-binding protein [Candidatus Berkelbacteria bacterium]|nr:biotin/lipoyl-binding protein [Candidatus Berkelbacteria bacterium]